MISKQTEQWKKKTDRKMQVMQTKKRKQKQTNKTLLKTKCHIKENWKWGREKSQPKKITTINT